MGQIYLIGFMGTGKSTVARQLAKLTKRSLIDSDDEIVKRIGMSISDYFEKHGEATFRELEHKVLEEISRGEDAVISCGGGVALRLDNLTCMHTYGTTFLLTATPETILQRVATDEKRPLLRGKKNIPAIRELMAARVPYYEKAADYQVATDDKTPREVAEQILNFSNSLNSA